MFLHFPFLWNGWNWWVNQVNPKKWQSWRHQLPKQKLFKNECSLDFWIIPISMKSGITKFISSVVTGSQDSIPEQNIMWLLACTFWSMKVFTHYYTHQLISNILAHFHSVLQSEVHSYPQTVPFALHNSYTPNIYTSITALSTLVVVAPGTVSHLPPQCNAVTLSTAKSSSCIRICKLF